MVAHGRRQLGPGQAARRGPAGSAHGRISGRSRCQPRGPGRGGQGNDPAIAASARHAADHDRDTSRWSSWSRRRPPISCSNCSASFDAFTPTGATGRKIYTRSSVGYSIGRWLDDRRRWPLRHARWSRPAASRVGAPTTAAAFPSTRTRRRSSRSGSTLDKANANVLRNEITTIDNALTRPLDGHAELQARAAPASGVDRIHLLLRTTIMSLSARRTTSSAPRAI